MGVLKVVLRDEHSVAEKVVRLVALEADLLVEEWAV